MKKLIPILALSFLSIIFPILLFSQINIYPPVAFIDSKSKSGSVTLLNNGSSARELTLRFRFGYFTYDSVGNKNIDYDSKLGKEYSLEPFIRVFPEKLVLKPKENQVVRFYVKAPADLKDGTYWVRLEILDRSQKRQIDSAHQNLNVSFELIKGLGTVVLMQKGKCNTNLNVSYIKNEINKENLNLYFTMNRDGGNSPFWGTLVMDVYNEDTGKKIVESYKEPLSIYFNSVKRILLNSKDFPPGRYRAEIMINNKRDEIPEGKEAKFSTLNKTFNFIVK